MCELPAPAAASPSPLLFTISMTTGFCMAAASHGPDKGKKGPMKPTAGSQLRLKEPNISHIE